MAVGHLLSARLSARRASRSRARPGGGRPASWRLAGLAAFVLVGFACAVSAVNAHGTDLRAERNTDLPELVRSLTARDQSRAAQVAALQAQVAALSGQVADNAVQQAKAAGDRLAPAVGLTAVSGTGVTVTLNDAPESARADPAATPDDLVVHQQDIQAVVNALWAGGARAVSVQGQRIITTTAVRCVGNSVVLQGVPYPPPYKIVGIGDVGRLTEALSDSPEVEIYLQYVDRFGLGYNLGEGDRLTVPAYTGALTLDYAHSPVPAG